MSEQSHVDCNDVVVLFQVQTELSNVAINNNDDRILHCCLLYQHKVAESGGLVVLFSNDTQLCSKAMVNQVRALNRKVGVVKLSVESLVIDI